MASPVATAWSRPASATARSTSAMREGADPQALIELRRYLGRPFARAPGSMPPAFDRLLSDNYAADAA